MLKRPSIGDHAELLHHEMSAFISASLHKRSFSETLKLNGRRESLFYVKTATICRLVVNVASHKLIPIETVVFGRPNADNVERSARSLRLLRKRAQIRIRKTVQARDIFRSVQIFKRGTTENDFLFSARRFNRLPERSPKSHFTDHSQNVRCLYIVEIGSWFSTICCGYSSY